MPRCCCWSARRTGSLSTRVSEGKKKKKKTASVNALEHVLTTTPVHWPLAWHSMLGLPRPVRHWPVAISKAEPSGMLTVANVVALHWTTLHVPATVPQPADVQVRVSVPV